MDPGKLKVVELRAELQKRGLDTKGNKAVLVKRLKDALEAELQEELPDTSIADTSTEDLNTSQEETEKDEAKPEKDPTDLSKPIKESSPEPEIKSDIESNVKIELASDAEVASKEPEQPIPAATEVKIDATEETYPNKEPELEQTHDIDEVKPKEEAALEDNQNENTSKMEEAVDQAVADNISEQNGENGAHEADEESVEPKNRKSRWGDAESEETKIEEVEPMEQQVEQTSDKLGGEMEARGDKRKHSSPSPDRANQRRRSKSPVKEDDEPVVDPTKVQLNWYDSDLHLDIDKETFLSGKPFYEGLFGYVWSGARLSHGIKVGKVCYEVKITEELKFEDILRFVDRRDKSREKKDKIQDEKTKEGESNEAESAENEGSDKTDADVEMKNEEGNVEETGADEASAEEDKPEQAEEKMDADEEKEEKEESAESSVKDEKVKFEGNDQEVKADEDNLYVPSHLIRIGWSTLSSNLQLGEDKLSFGLESSGKFFNDKQFTEHDLRFGVGDVVCAYLDLSEETITLSYSVNGEIKVTKTFDRSEMNEDDLALFPHVITRNYAFEINVGGEEEAWSVHSDEYVDYEFISKVDDKISGVTGPTSRGDCEVIMMCGLPGSGKTRWVKEHVEKTDDKQYTIIGSSYILERMSVDGQPMEDRFNKGKWNVVIDKLTKCLNKLCDVAAHRKRNFILDQTNVFPAAQRRKMRSFWGFKRHAVIVVNEDEEQMRRLKLQESQTGKDMPDSAVLEMKANMSLPRTGEWLEKVTYVALPEGQAKRQVQKYNAQGREAGFGNLHRRDYRSDRDYNRRGGNHGQMGGHRRDYRSGGGGGNFRDNRSYHNNRYGDRGPRQGNWRPGGGHNYGGPRNDRRDNRGPRDYRNNNRGGPMFERHHRGGNRDHRNSSGSSGNFNRNRNLVPSSSGGRNSNNWSGQSGGNGSNWSSSQNSGGSWSSSQQSQSPGYWGGQGWNSGQGNWNQNQWKYGYSGGYNYAANYYGQYAQNWGSQGQSGQTTSQSTATTASTTTTDSNQQYAQMTPQQQQAAWAQYAQQYAQSTTNQTQK